MKRFVALALAFLPAVAYANARSGQVCIGPGQRVPKNAFKAAVDSRLPRRRRNWQVLQDHDEENAWRPSREKAGCPSSVRGPQAAPRYDW